MPTLPRLVSCTSDPAGWMVVRAGSFALLWDLESRQKSFRARHKEERVSFLSSCACFFFLSSSLAMAETVACRGENLAKLVRRVVGSFRGCLPSAGSVALCAVP